jgi:ATP-binding cassette subfamily A (ABC1) protein 3
LACFIMTLLGNEPGDEKPHLLRTVDILTWILRFTPSFCLGKGIFNAINIYVFAFLAGDLELSAWSEPVLLYEVIFLACQSIAYLLLAIQLDRWSTNPRALSIWQRFIAFVTCRWIQSHGNDQMTDISIALPEDDDVSKEQDRVAEGGANDDLIVLSQLTKIYDNGMVAVNNMSLGIAPGECFGLLGINGAGKTTTMGMLTAEFPPTSGDATLAGFSVSNEPEKTRRRIGYCPQFDAHFDNLTGREHVELYASIKGVPLKFVKEAAAAKLAEVGLSVSDSDRLSAGYSGGMKRRLSLACATIGQPQIVFLDECSTGVDPVARREIWQLISDMVSDSNVPREERTSVILTTHSMEECEALCPRIGIMATGQLRCLGSAQHLKNKFGKGYQVEMKVSITDREDDDFLINKAALARTKEPESSVRGDEEESPSSLEGREIYLNMDETLAALRSLTGDDRLSDMITVDNPTGYNIWKDASTNSGVGLDDLAAFGTSELRMFKLEAFMSEHYPTYVLRERQDSKARYEVNSEGVRISNIFASIEANKEDLRLADYGVSQTSLEQVFNMHAAEAERLKQGRNDA